MVLPTKSDERADPVRTCVGCRKRAAVRELLRVTAGSDAQAHAVVVPDPTATAPGRGAHLHPTTECFDLAVRRKAFGRALRVPAGLSAAPLADYLTSVIAPGFNPSNTHQGLEQ